MGISILSYVRITNEAWINSRRPYIQQFQIMGHRGGAASLSNYQMRLDVMTEFEVRWTCFRPAEIYRVCFSIYHDLLAHYSIIGMHMPKRFVRQLDLTQGIPYAPIISPIEHCRSASIKFYVVKHTLTKVF